MLLRSSALRVTAIAAAVVGVLVPAQLASAGGPTRQPTNNQSGVLPAGFACTFALGVDVVTDREVTTTWPADPSGDVRSHISGTLVLRLTNEDTGAAIVVNVSGPVDTVVHADGSQDIVFTGNSALVVPPGGTPPAPDAILTSGRAVEHATPDGQFTLVGVSGRTQDVCRRLS
jgi:hypothetical protein